MPNLASAQGVAAGARDSNGRILTKVVVTMNEPGAFGRPAADLTFLVVAPDGDRTSIRTNEAGVASTWLAAGTYRFVTPDPLIWEGFAYTWDRVILVDSRTGVVQLTQDEARSVAYAPGDPRAARTSEPVSLSSKPAAWKASAPPTQDLRAAAIPVSAKSTPVKAPAVAARAPIAVSPEARNVDENQNSPVMQRNASTKLRSGFWFNLSTGYGAISCKNCSSALGGYSGGLSLGATVSPRVRFGVGTTSWYRSEGGDALVAGTLDARIRFYPSTSGGFFLTGGAGAGTIGAALADYGAATEYGVGVMLGLGWDVRLGNAVSLTPFWNGFAVQTENADANVGQLGLGLTFHQ
ncbi:MAG: hypothetical protein ABI556_02090 [Gemmatimonadales bacterium]